MSALPTQARVVIIGGGVVGCSVAYHLAREGVTDVVVLERSRLTSGTTWHAAGLVRRLRPSATLTRLIDHSIDLYRGLEAETGQATGWLQTGSLALATNPDRLTHLRRQVSLGRAFGLEAEEIDAARAGALWPLARTDDVIGAVWSPADGRVNPSDVALALARGARARGVRIVEDTPVTGFESAGGRISAVLTGAGRMACESVALCCGLWSREMAALAGAHAPLHACEHFYLLTEPVAGIEGHLPTLNDQDAHLYARDEVGGLLVGCFEPHARALPLERLPRDFSFDLLDEDWDHFEPMMRNALHRIPALRDAGVRMLLNGPESFTLDGQFMVGESPDVGGLFLLCGMNSTGIALAGGAGRALAEWMVAGEPTVDLVEADARRFAPGQDVLRALRERIPEVLGKHYALAYPGAQMDTARGQRRSPLHPGLAAAGARFTSRNGWERPEFFAPHGLPQPWRLSFGRPPWRDLVGEEHRAALESVALFDQSAYGKILVDGPDAEALLQRVCAADLAVQPGRVVYTSLLNPGGGIESDLTVHRLGAERFLVVTGAGQVTRDLAWLERWRGAARASLVDVTSAWAIIGLAGPRATAVLSAAGDAALPAIGRFGSAEVESGYAAVRAARLSYTGEPGYELYVPAEYAAGVHEALVAAGADEGLRHAGMHAVGSLRLEAGLRAWGHDLTPSVSPVEAGTVRFCATDKPGGFVGRDALVEALETGPARRLVSLVLDDAAAVPLHDEPVVHDGAVVGQITSAAWSYRLGRSIALALVRAPLQALAAGEVVDLEVEIACRRFAARASLAPPREAFATPREATA